MFARFSNSELAMIALALEEEEETTRNRKRVRRKWVRSAWKARPVQGAFRTLFPCLMDDETKFYEYFKMTRGTFNQLLIKLDTKLKKKHTFWRLPVTSKERLAVCLRFLVTGENFKSISFSYRLGKSTVGAIIHDTCRAVVDVLLDEAMPPPNENEWHAIADDFWTRWHFPNCIGALVGSHITIQAPKKSRSPYWNNEELYSIVLLALVDPCCNFIAVDVEDFAKYTDGNILPNSNLGKSLETNAFNIPKMRTLRGTEIELPMVVAADEAFPLRTYMMKPYSAKVLTNEQAMYNDRLRRARSVTENAFANMQRKFGIFTRVLQGKPENITMIVRAACTLYNFVRKSEDHTSSGQMGSQNENTGRFEGRSNLRNLPRLHGRPTNAALLVREQFKDFLNSPQGGVEWQEYTGLEIT